MIENLLLTVGGIIMNLAVFGLFVVVLTIWHKGYVWFRDNA